MINTIDLFAGCGGLTDGFKSADEFRSLAAIEWELWPCETLKQRLVSKWGYAPNNNVVLRFDIQRTQELFRGWENDPLYGSHNGLDKVVGDRNVDLIIGGPPCQAYSIAGRVRDKNGMQDDYRNFLFEAFMKVVSHYRPKAFVFENVEGMLSAKPGGVTIVERIIKEFEKFGYATIRDFKKYALINAVDYGVPQNRKRVIILGVNKTELGEVNPDEALKDFYLRILPKYRSGKSVTVEEAISDLPKLMPISGINPKPSHSPCRSDIQNHTPRFHSKRDQRIFRELASDVLNGRLRYPNAESLISLYFKETGKVSKFHKHHVLDKNLPSTTIPAHLFKDGLRHIHPDPDQARSITPREAARLQGFDDDFNFFGSIGEQYKMIGNAVPPPLGRAIGLATRDFFKMYLR